MAEPVVKVQIEGLAELEQKLRDETKKVAVRTLRRAAKDASEIWENAISERAPSMTGFLKSQITMSSKAVGGDEGRLQVMVGPSKKAFYGIFQEFGTRYQKAHPFVRPAFEQTKDAVLAKFVEDLRDELSALQEHH
jgi:HK97 gp10 family phage protein